MYYPFLGVTQGHHGASHNNNSDGYEAISRWHMSQFAYLAAKLNSMPEGDGTVLDNSCLMFLSSLFVGRTHDNTRLPLVLAGGTTFCFVTDGIESALQQAFQAFQSQEVSYAKAQGFTVSTG